MTLREGPRSRWCELALLASAVADFLRLPRAAFRRAVRHVFASARFSREHSGAVVIAAGRTRGGQLTHAVPSPSHIRLERTASGADATLEIESADGTMTLVRFKTAASSAQR